MKIQSRTEIKIEKHEIRTVRMNSGNGSVYCSTCNEQTVTLTPDQLASFLKVSVPEICRQIDASEIHLADSDRTLGLICGRSLETEEMPEAPDEHGDSASM
jgi:hypothetical protein